MSPLTPKQLKVLAFIQSFTDQEGYPPSQQEIARAFGFSSLGTVQNHLVRLEREGALARDVPAYHEVVTQLSGVRRMEQLFVAMANGPFMLLLHPNDANAFLTSMRREPVQRVTIHWVPREGPHGDWTITPAESSNAWRLSFALPDALRDWIFADEEKARRVALQAKERFLADITVYHFEGRRPELWRLVYDPEETMRRVREK